MCVCVCASVNVRAYEYERVCSVCYVDVSVCLEYMW